jgi:hypothetical protein
MDAALPPPAAAAAESDCCCSSSSGLPATQLLPLNSPLLSLALNTAAATLLGPPSRLNQGAKLLLLLLLLLLSTWLRSST